MPFKFMHDRSGSRRLAASVIAVGFTVLCGACVQIVQNVRESGRNGRNG